MSTKVIVLFDAAVDESCCCPSVLVLASSSSSSRLEPVERSSETSGVNLSRA